MLRRERERVAIHAAARAALGPGCAHRPGGFAGGGGEWSWWGWAAAGLAVMLLCPAIGSTVTAACASAPP
jgi:hypothetical protein